MKKTALFMVLPILIIFLAAGSAAAETTDFSEQPSGNNKELRIALVPEQNVFEQRRRYSYLTDYLSKKTGLNVYVDIMSNYGEICSAFIDKKADIGFFGSFSYVLTRAKAGIEPIARPVWPDGSSTYRGYIFTRRDSGIRNVSDMKDKSLALVDKATTAGYIYQLYYMHYYSIENLPDFFSKIYFAGSHDAAAWAVYTGEADIGGAKDRIFKALSAEYPDFKKQMVILAESPEVPSNGMAVRKDLNPALKLRLKGLMLSLHETEEGKNILEHFGAAKFIETSDNDYKVLYSMINEVGIDLSSFPYKN